MNCFKCHQPLDIDRKFSFREVCPHCGADLHCCKGCRFYAEGKPNNCLIPGTDYVANREANNYCDEFKPIEKIADTKSPSRSEVEKKLFGDDGDDQNNNSSFDSLFKF